MDDRPPRAPSEFGGLLRRYRLAARLSQGALAERAGLSLYGISALERGYRRTPHRETLEMLVEALGLNNEQRRAFETAAARAVLPRRRSATLAAPGPWPRVDYNGLPVALSRFVGRETELEEIGALLRVHQLVTITGSGGVGKTQTALRAVAAQSDRVDAEVCFVALAPIGDPSLVTAAIATELGVQEVPNHPLRETLAAFLKNKTVLLVLDNCEHLIVDLTAVADWLLRTCPNLRILATSREPLRTSGERAYRLPPLNEDDAVSLFEDRAQAADARFALGQDATVVGEICRRLDGIPLAIELAAARVTVLPPSILAKALSDRFGVLFGADRQAPQRQQTMRATIDWSYDLLSAPEQRLFECLSVFAGGYTIATASTVCGDCEPPATSVLALVSSLVTKSLVEAALGGHEPRYRLLEPFREYAREKLVARGERDAIARRHALAYLQLAEHFARTRDEQHYSAFYGHPRAEIGNYRAAVQWALTERHDLQIGQRLVAEIVCLWSSESTVLGDARRWVPAALDTIDQHTPPDIVAALRLAEATLAMRLDNHRLQLASAEKANKYYRETGNERALMQAQVIAGNALFDLERSEEARPILEEALCIARKRGCQIAYVLRNLACACMDVGDLVAARAYLTEASRLIEADDDQATIPLLTFDLAALAFSEGNPSLAVQHINGLFATSRELHSNRRIGVLASAELSKYLITLDLYEEAREHAREALAGAREEHLDVLAARAMGYLASAAVLEVRDEASRAPSIQIAAARVLGFVDVRFRALGVETATYVGIDRVHTALNAVLGAEAMARLAKEGATMTEDAAVKAAMSM